MRNGRSGGERDEQTIESFSSLTVEPLEHPPLRVDSLDDYTQWKRASNAKAGTDPASFFTLPGFEVELLRSAGKEENSWVSMAFDLKGRITIGREDKGLLRFSLSPAGSIVRVERIEDTLKECRGLLYAHGALYANANNSRALYRLRDLDGDGQFEERNPANPRAGARTQRFGPRAGWNDLRYHGDSVHIPKAFPIGLRPSKHALALQTERGSALRMDKDGKRIEIFVAGCATLTALPSTDMAKRLPMPCRTTWVRPGTVRLGSST